MVKFSWKLWDILPSYLRVWALIREILILLLILGEKAPQEEIDEITAGALMGKENGIYIYTLKHEILPFHIKIGNLGIFDHTHGLWGHYAKEIYQTEKDKYHMIYLYG